MSSRVVRIPGIKARWCGCQVKYTVSSVSGLGQRLLTANHEARAYDGLRSERLERPLGIQGANVILEGERTVQSSTSTTSIALETVRASSPAMDAPSRRRNCIIRRRLQRRRRRGWSVGSRTDRCVCRQIHRQHQRVAALCASDGGLRIAPPLRVVYTASNMDASRVIRTLDNASSSATVSSTVRVPSAIASNGEATASRLLQPAMRCWELDEGSPRCLRGGERRTKAIGRVRLWRGGDAPIGIAMNCTERSNLRRPDQALATGR